MKLHPINHDLKTTLWCGPAALATVTGKPVSECVAALQKTTRKTAPIKGVTNLMLTRAAAHLGIKLVELPPPVQETFLMPTLAAWTRCNRHEFAAQPVIVNVTGHYVVVSGRSFNDNHTRTPVNLKKAPHRRARVQHVFRCEPLPPGSPVPEVLPKDIPPRVAHPEFQARCEARRLAALFGVEVERDVNTNDLIWVYPPKSLAWPEEKDRHAGDHATYSWAEALRRVKEYIEDLTTPAINATV